METFIPYLLPFVLLLPPLFLYFVFFINKKGSGHLKNLPPGSEGWPILGETYALTQLGFHQLVRDKMQKYSSQVFKTTLFGETMAVLCGAQGNKFVFTNENKLVKPWFPRSLRKALFPDLDETRSMEPEAQFHNFQHEVLKTDALKEFVPVMDALACEHLHDEWRPNTVVKVFASTKKYTLELACKVFMNVVDPERLGKLLEPFTLLSNGLISLPINLPGTTFSRAIKGGRVVRGEVMRIIKERKKELMMESEGRRDLLSKLLLATNKDGKYMSETKVANIMIGLLAAGQYEVSSAITIVVNYLAQLPHIYNQVLEEQMEIAKSKGTNEVLTWDDVEKMKYTWNVVLESLRLAPPSLGAFREATAEFTYGGCIIPKGWKVMWTSHSSHRNPEDFPEPEKFDPSRFEGRGPAPYTYVPFGGGSRMCPGRGYARLVILIFIHNIVMSFRFDKVIPNEEILFYRLASEPAHGLPIRLHPRC